MDEIIYLEAIVPRTKSGDIQTYRAIRQTSSSSDSGSRSIPAIFEDNLLPSTNQYQKQCPRCVRQSRPLVHGSSWEYLYGLSMETTVWSQVRYALIARALVSLWTVQTRISATASSAEGNRSFTGERSDSGYNSEVPVTYDVLHRANESPMNNIG